ncbi:sulfatase [Polaribacter sp. Q13]|uniref:sulfatase family protein n=1 Tax=Polaribacter sp. Q13 TaxID=2806551 RepID=UPI00193B66C2|nr:sulfatase [Polaribacter sp. Q13]QVY66082.1 sulfatase [Polaribacter sp. Q13]
MSTKEYNIEVSESINETIHLKKKENKKKVQPPNVLILFLDDLDPNFGCYGNDLVKTPNIDKLASEGMLFTRSYAAAAVCSPSHTTLFTGCYASTIGAAHHRSTYIDKLPKGYFILTELMKDAGYFTVNFKSDGDRMYNKIYGATAKTDLNFDRGKPENNQESGKEVFEHLKIINPKNIATYFKGGVWDKKSKNQPFFAYANIETGKKHGFIPGRKWAKENGVSIDSTQVKIPPHYADTKEVRSVLTASMDAVSHVDFEVGKFLKALKNEGLDKNTLVILASDHGATLSRHKQQLWTTGIKIPMIIRWPGKVIKSSVNSELASIIDIAPTCLTAAKTNVPTTMEGLNLLGSDLQKRKYLFATKDGMDGTFDASRSVISKEYQFIYHYFPEIPFNGNGYARRTLSFKSMVQLQKENKLTALQEIYYASEKRIAIELYDLERDVDQIKNLADDTNYQKIVESYKNVLSDWQKKTGDEILNARKILGVKKVPLDTKVDEIINRKTSK